MKDVGVLHDGCDFIFFFSSRRRHTRWPRDWSSDVCSSDLKYSLASPTAKGKARPLARPAAMAAAKVQPVPWVWRVSTRDRVKVSSPAALRSKSGGSGAEAGPRLSRTAWGPLAHTRWD